MRLLKRTEKVNSSMLTQISYNKFNKKLVADFQTGQRYQYTNVPRKFGKLLFQAHDSNKSVGSVFSALIRNNKDIPYTKVGFVGFPI